MPITVLYLTRSQWVSRLPIVPIRVPFLYEPVPDSGSSFRDDAASGLQSSNFDLSGNIESGDSRGGLDDRAKREVQRVMKSKRVNFDEARRLVVEERFRREGIGADGRPRDPKFVSFS